MTSLLVEFQTEELPPKALKKLSAAFAEGVFHGIGLGGNALRLAASHGRSRDRCCGKVSR